MIDYMVEHNITKNFVRKPKQNSHVINVNMTPYNIPVFMSIKKVTCLLFMKKRNISKPAKLNYRSS